MQPVPLDTLDLEDEMVPNDEVESVRARDLHLSVHKRHRNLLHELQPLCA
jgi:hypothetical protein